MLKFTILALNASSSSTKVLKCPHNKDDCIFRHNSSTIYSFGITYDSQTHKDEHMHDFSHRLALIFQSTLVSAHSRSPKVFSRLVAGLSVKKKDKAQGGSSKVHTSHKVGHKRVNGTNGKNSRCHHTIVQSKLITQGIGTNIKQDSTLSS
ncbi:hypothetical protein H5410_015605 [Solanum commersonii]|uniref:Uncharacterized protein n=1 Tax=Solanum commersonii TaxID=4109 RepID=A0A9J5ZTZ3_SOLCO|nr:hypothetical protein H5410_015605 [Solanum commersonii]